MSAVVLFERARGGGVGGGPGHVSMAKWARFCICNRQEETRHVLVEVQLARTLEIHPAVSFHRPGSGGFECLCVSYTAPVAMG
jgi:hypothetical protein